MGCRQWETFPLEITENEHVTVEYFGNSCNSGECSPADVRKIMFSDPDTQISKYICGVLNSSDGNARMLIYGAAPLSGRVQGILIDEADRFKLMREIRMALNSISKYHPSLVSVSTVDVEARERKNSIAYFEKKDPRPRLVLIKIFIRNNNPEEFYTVNDVYYTITRGKPSVMTPEQIYKKYKTRYKREEERRESPTWTKVSADRTTYSSINQCKALLSPRYLKQ